MKKLPDIYKIPNSHYITNNNTIYYCNTKKDLKKEEFDINLFLNDLNHLNGNIYNKKVFIETYDNNYTGYIIYYDNFNIFLDNNTIINKDKIVNIKRVQN